MAKRTAPIEDALIRVERVDTRTMALVDAEGTLEKFLRLEDHRHLVSITISTFEQGRRSSNPTVTVATRSAGIFLGNGFSITHKHSAGMAGVCFDILSCIFLHEGGALVTGTRELSDFVKGEDEGVTVEEAKKQMSQLVRLLRGTGRDSMGREAVSNNLFLAGDLDPSQASPGDLVTIFVDTDTEEVVEISGSHVGLVVAGVDHLRGRLTCFRSHDGVRTELVEVPFGSVIRDASLLLEPCHPMWKAVSRSPENNPFFFAVHSHGRIGEKLALVHVNGHVSTIVQNGAFAKIKEHACLLTDKMMPAILTQNLYGRAPIMICVDRDASFKPPHIRLFAGDRIPAVLRELMARLE